MDKINMDHTREHEKFRLSLSRCANPDIHVALLSCIQITNLGTKWWWVWFLFWSPALFILIILFAFLVTVSGSQLHVAWTHLKCVVCISCIQCTLYVHLLSVVNESTEIVFDWTWNTYMYNLHVHVCIVFSVKSRCSSRCWHKSSLNGRNTKQKELRGWMSYLKCFLEPNHSHEFKRMVLYGYLLITDSLHSNLIC